MDAPGRRLGLSRGGVTVTEKERGEIALKMRFWR